MSNELIDYKETARKILEALDWVSMTSYERDCLREDMEKWKELLK